MKLATQEPFVRAGNETSLAGLGLREAATRTPDELAEIVSLVASSNVWIDKVRLRADRRWYERLYHGPDHDIWIISWLPGQSTGFHDHGGSSGAVVVTTGSLEEHRLGEGARVINSCDPLSFGPNYAHDVRNVSLAPAISIHAYSPPLEDMNEYELDGGRLIPREHTSEGIETANEAWRMPKARPLDNRDARGIEDVLAAARTRLRRVSPDEAYDAMVKKEATLVDIRPESQRAIEGSIPDALIVERNVLEWRFDPACSARLPFVTDHDIRVIVFCSEGYTSSLAAASLQDLGLHRATDMNGGFQGWKAMGLPIIPPINIP